MTGSSALDGDQGFPARSFLRSGGLDAGEVRRRPVIGICTSWSELNPCNLPTRELAAAVKRGVRGAGGVALEFPTISLAEALIQPTTMLLRNLMAMDVEEMITASPVDGVVLLNGCDKTVAAQLMGALSADKPALSLGTGHRPAGTWRGQRLTIDDSWRLADERRVGAIDDAGWADLASSPPSKPEAESDFSYRETGPSRPAAAVASGAARPLHDPSGKPTGHRPHRNSGASETGGAATARRPCESEQAKGHEHRLCRLQPHFVLGKISPKMSRESKT